MNSKFYQIEKRVCNTNKNLGHTAKEFRLTCPIQAFGNGEH